MAKQVITKVTDDLDGSENAYTVHFGLDGKSYEIDLSEKNAEKLHKALAPFIEKARRSGYTPPAKKEKGERLYDIGQLREWAASKGIEIPARGRIPQTIVDQYLADH